MGDDPQRLCPGWLRLSSAAGLMREFRDEVVEVKVAGTVMEEKETGNILFLTSSFLKILTGGLITTKIFTEFASLRPIAKLLTFVFSRTDE